MHNVEDLYPLTPTQGGMLFQCLHEQDSQLYFEQVRADIVGEIEPATVKRAFETVTSRHPALRTAIVWEGLESPLQVVHGDVQIPFDLVDRPGMSSDELDVWALERRSNGFDLTKAPAQRVAIVDRGAGGLHLVWEFHHILCDGWSAAMVLDEVVRLCNGAQLDAHAPAFRDYLAWHQAQDNEATAAYWKQLLDGFGEPTTLALPRASNEAAFRAGQCAVSVGGSDLDEIRAFARAQRVTLNSLVQTAWAHMQSVYSGGDDVIFGVTTSGRPAEMAEVQSIVGMFLNTLPMRVALTPEMTVEDVIRSIQEQQLASSEHSSASLADLHRQVGLGVGEDLFDTVLIFENFPKPEADLSVEQLISLENKTVFEQTNYPLTLMVGIDGDLKLVANFDQNRFDRSTIVRLMTQFGDVLSALPQAATIGDLPVLSSEDAQAIDSWQGDEIALSSGDTVASRLLAQAQRTPEAVALIEGNESLTYVELVARGSDVATRLRTLGVGAEVAVGVALRRSIDMVVAMVGIVLAGGAYVPLDPRFPQPRLERMLKVSGAPVVLTNTTARHSIPTIEGVEYIDITAERPGPAVAQVQAVVPNPSDTMLLTFTSGSTGIPKGVKVHHAGVLNRCEWQWAQYPIEPGEVVPHKTTLGFVDHLWEVWGGLLSGATVLLIDDDVVTDPDALIDVLGVNGVRRISLVPSLLDLLMDHEPHLAGRLPLLSMWSVSGEALAHATAKRFATVLPNASLINLYGMSEASQDATFSVVDAASDHVTIGRPIANMRVHLLDHHDRSVPVGVPGQIHLSGAGLSTGYWQRDDLTAERFVPNPASPDEADPHHRMYRSGDIARWRADGMLEYLGRTDHQVKVRGVRIELGEVETALAAHSSVSRAVVVGRPGASGTELVAYVVLGSESEVDLASLRAHAQNHLPEVMVPSRFVPMRDFPQLPNGKVNRDALPAPVDVGPEADSPSHELGVDGRKMLGVWRSVLGQPSLGADVDFFDAGGHSMLAMRLVSRIKKDLGLSVGLSQLLRTGTVRSLSEALRSAGRPGRAGFVHVVPIVEAQPGRRNFFIVHGAGGDVLNFRQLARQLAGTVNVIGIQAAGVDGVAAIHADREEMVEAYLDEIRQFQAEGPYLLAGFSIGGLIAVELAERLQSDSSRVDAIVLFDTFHPSQRPRSIPRSEHLKKLIKDPRYGLDRLQGRVRARRNEKERERWLAPDTVGPVPFEVRKWEITNASIALWHNYEPPSSIKAPVVVVSAMENSDIWDGIADDRGWSADAETISVLRVPGDHMTLVEEPNTPALVSLLAPVLGSFGFDSDE